MRKLRLPVCCSRLACRRRRRPGGRARNAHHPRRRLRPRRRHEPVRRLRLRAARLPTTGRSSRHYYTGTALGAARHEPRRPRAAAGRPRRRRRFTGRAERRRRRPRPGQDLQRRPRRRRPRDPRARRRKLGTTAGPAARRARRSAARLLLGASVPGVRDGRYRGALEFRRVGRGRATRSTRSASRTTSAASSAARARRPGRPRRCEAQAVAARTYAITTNAGGSAASPVRRHALADVPRRRGRDADDRRRRRATRGPGRHLRRQARSRPTSSRPRGGQTENIENSFVGSRAEAVAEGRRRPVRRPLAQAPLGAVQLHARRRRARSSAAWSRAASSASRCSSAASSPRIVRAQVVGTDGHANVTGPQLRKRFGLFDTWAYFTTVERRRVAEAGRRRPRPRRRPARRAPTDGRRAGRRRAAAAPRARARPDRRASPRRSPAPGSRVQRRDGRATWVTVAGRRRLAPRRPLRVALPGAGRYRVVCGRRPTRPRRPRALSRPGTARASDSATQTGFSPPSRSNVCVTVICTPPGTSSTLASVARMRTFEPTGSGAGKRTLLVAVVDAEREALDA